MNAMAQIHTPPPLVTPDLMSAESPEFVRGYLAALNAMMRAASDEREKAEVDRAATPQPSIFGGGQEHCRHLGRSAMASHLYNIAMVTAELCRKVQRFNDFRG